MSNTVKARSTAQRHIKPIDTPKPTIGHCTTLQRDEIQLHQSTRTQAQAPPTRKTQDINPTPYMGADFTTKKNYDLENFFFNYKSHCLFPLPISTFTLAICGPMVFHTWKRSVLFLFFSHLKKIILRFFSFLPFFLLVMFLILFLIYSTAFLYSSLPAVAIPECT